MKPTEAKEKTIRVNNGYVEIENIPSPDYGYTTAAGSIEQAVKNGFLSCGDGQNYKLNWREKHFLKMTGIITEVTEERYYEALEVLPPAYISRLNGELINSGFAVCETVTGNKRGGIWNIYFERDGKYFTTYANIMSKEGKYFQDCNNMEYSKGNTAIALQTI